MTCRFFF